MVKYREERDVLGKIKVPANAYYGSETQRSVNNFKISNIKLQPEFIYAYALIKRAGAIANMKAHALDHKKAMAIVKACDEIISGKFQDQFVVDLFQAGAGTSTNMNLNEVIANRATEILGGKKGLYNIVHPNDHVNMSQSTNDTMPSAIRLSAYIEARTKLLPELTRLANELHKKSEQFEDIVKVGRTHLQDAVPIKLGSEFSGYANAIVHVKMDLMHSIESLRELPLGGTAVGTGMNAKEGFARNAIAELNKHTKYRFKQSRSLFEAMQNRLVETNMANTLDEIAIALNKIANDFRLLSSGPRSGFADIELPAVQPGSSIMPGKINPSMAEMLNMACMQVRGSCTALREAANAGQLELNVFMPIIAYNLLFSIQVLSGAVHAFTESCVKGIKANKRNIEQHLEMNMALATALSPKIGYAKAAEIAKKAYDSGKSVREVCIEMKILPQKILDSLLDSKKLV